jgi:hypothetical protein
VALWQLRQEQRRRCRPGKPVIGQRRTLAFGCGVAVFNRWDSAVAESFISTLKLDLLHRYSWPTRAAARSSIFEFTDVFHNRQRRHSTLGNRGPADYESDHAAVCSS